MSKTYTKNTDAEPIIRSLTQKHYPDLAKAEVTFQVLECEGGVKLHGRDVTDVVKVLKLEDRASGSEDVRIVLDADEWETASKNRRTAILDHALAHLEVVRDKKSDKIKLDDVGRPRIRIRQHDFELGGFYDVVRRHKEQSVEAQHIAYFANQLKQQAEFDWTAAELIAAASMNEKTEPKAEKEAA